MVQLQNRSVKKSALVGGLGISVMLALGTSMASAAPNRLRKFRLLP